MLMLFLVSISAGASRQVVELQPGMPVIESPGVPMLNAAREEIPEADLMDEGLKLEPETPFRWVISPGETLIANVSALELEESDRVVLTAWDWRNMAVAQLEFSVPFARKISFQVDGRGTYLLTLDRFESGRHISRLARSFSVCPSNKERREKWKFHEFFIGVAAFPDRQDWKDNFGYMRPAGLTDEESAGMEADLSARLGIQTVRLNAGLEWIFDMYESRGINPYLQVWQEGDVLPRYANVSDAKWRYPKQEKPMRQHYTDIAKRFGKRAFFFEINNETDNVDFWRGTVEEYMENAGWAIEEFRTHAPDAIITNAGYTLLKPEMTESYVQAFKGKFDWVSIHTHGNLPDSMDVFHQARQYHQESGYENPIYANTEMGYCGWRLDIERLQAAVAIRKILYFWAQGFRGVVLYNCRDIVGPRRSAGWGYLDHFMCPRFKYGAVASLIDWYAGANFESILVEEPELYVYSFRCDDKYIAAVFSPSTEAEMSEVSFDSDATKILSIDPMGNVDSVVEGGSVTVRTGFFPVTVIFENASKVELDVGMTSSMSEY